MRATILLSAFLAQTLHAQSAPSTVTFLSDAELRRAIQTAPEEQAGQPGLYFVSLSPATEHPVIGIRRTSPTKSEVHAEFTDVWYVIAGAGTLVTGGTMVEGVDTTPGEIRGNAIKGGNSRRIEKGDFAVIPAGTPHWISSVEGTEILYVVVKVPRKT